MYNYYGIVYEDWKKSWSWWRNLILVQILHLANLSYWNWRSNQVHCTVGYSILCSVLCLCTAHFGQHAVIKVVRYTVCYLEHLHTNKHRGFFFFFFCCMSLTDIFVLQRDFTLKWEKAYITISLTHIRVCYGK